MEWQLNLGQRGKGIYKAHTLGEGTVEEKPTRKKKRMKKYTRDRNNKGIPKQRKGRNVIKVVKKMS